MQNQNSVSQNPVEIRKTPLFPVHNDGLGTFLAIAGRCIHEWAENGQLDDYTINLLHGQAYTAIHSMGDAFELLAMERIDYVHVNNSTITGALMTAGRAMAEFADIFDILQKASRRNERQRRKQAGNPPDCAEQDGWPLV